MQSSFEKKKRQAMLVRKKLLATVQLVVVQHIY